VYFKEILKINDRTSALKKKVFKVLYFIRNEGKHSLCFAEEEHNEAETFMEVSEFRHLKMISWLILAGTSSDKSGL